MIDPPKKCTLCADSGILPSGNSRIEVNGSGASKHDGLFSEVGAGFTNPCQEEKFRVGMQSLSNY